MPKFKLDTIVKTTKGCPYPPGEDVHAFVSAYYDKDTGEIGASEAEADEEYVEIHEIRANNMLGGIGAVHVKFLEEDNHPFWKDIKKRRDQYNQQLIEEAQRASELATKRHKRIIVALSKKHDISIDLMSAIINDYDDIGEYDYYEEE